MDERRLRKDERSDKKTKRVIALPIPGNLQVSYAADYENAALGALGGLMGGTVTKEQIGSGLTSAFNDITSVVFAPTR